MAHVHDRAWIPSSKHSVDYFSARPNVADSYPIRCKLPDGFPESIKTPMTWSGADFKTHESKKQFTFKLSDAHLLELEEACRRFDGLGLDFDHVACDVFRLPTLGTELKALAIELTRGLGFFLIQGLNPQRYSKRINVLMYLGISAYIGEKRGRQDELGNMLLHLTDVGSEIAQGKVRQAPYSNVGQPFHTDGSDIIALYSLGEAESGGESQLASTAMIYNEIASVRPDMIKLLASPTWIFDRFGQFPAFKVRSILHSLGDNNVMLSFSRRPLLGNDSSPRTPDIPGLPDGHVEALNAIHFAAEKHALSLKLKKGELLFWNNTAMLHARTGFTDSSVNRRHLIRLWLRSDENPAQIPHALQFIWSEAFDLNEGMAQRWPVEPIRDASYVINQQRSSGHA